jgi:rfaE bifunctional protein nucleotidyltransferase chain/domain
VSVPASAALLDLGLRLCNKGELNFRTKIVSYSDLASWRKKNRAGRLVVTNGCFDLLHLGHVTYLETARNLGDALLVGVNSDAAVRGLKGEGRPVNSEEDRAAVIAALESVSFVCIFPDVRATDFLASAQPDIYVKGGDYTLETLNQEERRAVESNGGAIHLIPFVPGKSTSSILKKVAAT